MKRTICISMTLALALLLLLCCAPALADEPETYELWLGSVQVTSENKDDILGDGKASYVPESRTLTLNDNPVIPGLYSKYSYINVICNIFAFLRNQYADTFCFHLFCMCTFGNITAPYHKA